tara:strand:- start:359 stop:1072 length:714 start_codon:yes stop_codon:yes gene_type:complete
MFIPMFSWNVFKVNLVEAGLLSERKMFAMQQECYTMRKNDPVGRARSNNGSGWQSNDGVNQRPMFQSLLNGVETVFDNEVFPFYVGSEKENIKLHHGNYWVNINYQHSYNNVHTHPGCWYSGVFYLKVPEETRGSGSLQFLSGQSKYMSDFTHCSKRDADNFVVDPKEGDLLLFPSSMLHYVEPNEVDFDRISIAFNHDYQYKNEGRLSAMPFVPPSFNDNLELGIDPDNGNLIFPK